MYIYWHLFTFENIKLSTHLYITCLALVLTREHENCPILDMNRPEELLPSVIPHSSIGSNLTIVRISKLRGIQNLPLHLNHRKRPDLVNNQLELVI